MSKKITVNTPAPDFSLLDLNGKETKLSQFKGNKNIILVFNRGFI